MSKFLKEIVLILLGLMAFPVISNGQSTREIHVYAGQQRLYLLKDTDTIASFDVSCSRYGMGQEANSNKTPLGKHRIHSKYGREAPEGTIFRARRSTGEVAQIEHEPISTGKDLVTSRILWLEGVEEGFNRGPGVDSYLRYIYIHGTHEEGLIGQPASHGCIRMRNKDVIELFEMVQVGTPVIIYE
jgi:hypothetical protein